MGIEPGMTVGVGFAILWQGSLTLFVDLHISTRENTRTQLQAPFRQRHVAVELDPAEGLVDCSPRCWIGHTPRFLNEPHHGHHCSVPLSSRAGSEPQEKMGSFQIVVSIVSWSKTANGRSMLILGQVFSSFCGLPVLTVAEMKRGERQSTLSTSIAASCGLTLS